MGWSGPPALLSPLYVLVPLLIILLVLHLHCSNFLLIPCTTSSCSILSLTSLLISIFFSPAPLPDSKCLSSDLGLLHEPGPLGFGWQPSVPEGPIPLAYLLCSSVSVSSATAQVEVASVPKEPFRDECAGLTHLSVHLSVHLEVCLSSRNGNKVDKELGGSEHDR